MFFGAYPTVSMVKNDLERLKYLKHSDWGAHNMIVQGARLNLIDQSIRHEGHGFNDRRERKYILLNEWVGLQASHDIEAFYFEHIKAQPCDIIAGKKNIPYIIRTAIRVIMLYNAFLTIYFRLLVR